MTSAALDRPASKSTHSRPSLFSGDIPRVALVVAAALVVLRISLAGFGLPLWLDENFSAAIAVQPTVHGLIDWCLNELSGPLYYSTLWAWEKVAGDSNAALRVPGHVIALATPLFLLWKGHPDREVRILWALMIGLWPLGFDIYITARPYAMVVFMGCVQAVAFLRLMEAPDTIGFRLPGFVWQQTNHLSSPTCRRQRHLLRQPRLKNTSGRRRLTLTRAAFQNF